MRLLLIMLPLAALIQRGSNLASSSTDGKGCSRYAGGVCVANEHKNGLLHGTNLRTALAEPTDAAHAALPADIVAEAQGSVSTRPSHAYSLAVSVITLLESKDTAGTATAAGEWEAGSMLLLASACRVAASAAAVLTMNAEAAAYYAQVVTVLELSPVRACACACPCVRISVCLCL